MFWFLTTKQKSLLIWLESTVIKSQFSYRSLISSLFPFSKREYGIGREEGREKSHEILFWVVSIDVLTQSIRIMTILCTFEQYSGKHILWVDERKCSAVETAP